MFFLIFSLQPINITVIPTTIMKIPSWTLYPWRSSFSFHTSMRKIGCFIILSPMKTKRPPSNMERNLWPMLFQFIVWIRRPVVIACHCNDSMVAVRNPNCRGILICLFSAGLLPRNNNYRNSTDFQRNSVDYTRDRAVP
jgi:hypothetical protein